MQKITFLQHLAALFISVLIFSQAAQVSEAFSAISPESQTGSQVLADHLLSLDVTAPCRTAVVPATHPLLSSDIVTMPPLLQNTAVQVPKKPSQTQSTPTSASFATNPSPTQTPTSTADATAVQISPTAEPEVASSSSEQTSGLNADLLFSLVNQYRVANGFTPFEENDTVCAIAEERAPEVASEIASGTMHAGFYALNLPYQATENIISMQTEQEAFDWWINDPIHKKAILSDAIYSCIRCSGNSCSEIFTSFVPK